VAGAGDADRGALSISEQRFHSKKSENKIERIARVLVAGPSVCIVSVAVVERGGELTSLNYVDVEMMCAAGPVLRPKLRDGLLAE
jgi:hypothetical protein